MINTFDSLRFRLRQGFQPSPKGYGGQVAGQATLLPIALSSRKAYRSVSMIGMIAITFISVNCFGSESEDPFAWTQNRPKRQTQVITENNKAKAQFTLSWPDRTKFVEKYVTTSVQRVAVMIASAFLWAYSTRALGQKKPNIKLYFLFGSSTLSFVLNKELVSFLNTKIGKCSLIALILTYLHKEIAQNLLSSEIFNLIYKK